MGRLVCAVAGALPGAEVTGVLALVGATGVAVGVGIAVNDGGAQAAPDRGVLAPETQVASGPSQQHTDGSASSMRSPGLSRSSGSASTGGVHQVSRGSDRPPLVSVQRATKAEAMPVSRQSMAGGVTQTVAPATPQDIALSMLADYGWSSSEFGCLDSLWVSESDWNISATNASSGAYGIPQALPADKMATAGPDWRTDPATQIAWGLDYIRQSYGTPCGAWSFKMSNNWY